MKLGRVYGEAEIVIPEGQVADYDMNLYTEVEIGPHSGSKRICARLILPTVQRFLRQQEKLSKRTLRPLM